VSGWPKRCELAQPFLRERSYKKLKLAQLLGRLGVFLTAGPICLSLVEYIGLYVGTKENLASFSLAASSAPAVRTARPPPPGVITPAQPGGGGGGGS
jgi:hypothetical protein